MKLIIISLLIAVACAERFNDFEDVESYMNSATLATVGEFPSAVFIEAPGVPVNTLCGGTIIDRSHVLTSAQCVLNAQNQLINPFWFTVTAGDNNMVNPTSRRQRRRVSRIFVHQNFNPITRNNDLAVLRVETPFPEFHNTIEPVIRTTQVHAPTFPCRLTGWGSAANATALQPDLRVMNAPIIDSNQCNAANVHANRVLANVHICAGSIAATAPASGACRGNLGSGLYCNNRLAGVLSFGFSCGVANQPGVYINTRVYEDWINQQLVRTDNPQPGWTPTPMNIAN